jgi:hypothetical protein
MVACVPFSSISRQRNALATGLDHGVVDVSAAGRRRHVRAVGSEDEFSTASLPDGIGTRTVMVRPSLLIFGFAITLPSALA